MPIFTARTFTYRTGFGIVPETDLIIASFGLRSDSGRSRKDPFICDTVLRYGIFDGLRKEDPGIMVLQESHGHGTDILHTSEIDHRFKIVLLISLPVSHTEIFHTVDAVDQSFVPAGGVLIAVPCLEGDSSPVMLNG
jgi:hypothetical protein